MTHPTETAETVSTPPTTASEFDRAQEYLAERLGSLGWSVRRNAKGVKARWRWLSIGVRYREGAEHPWHARMRDGMPRVTVKEAYGDDAVSALDPVVTYAREVENLCVGVGLFANPSKGYLGHRLWQAVRPADS